MSRKLRLAVVGLGKMGISHLSIAKAHPETDVIACDTSGFVLDALSKYTNIPVYRDYKALLTNEKLDGVVIATPNRLHADMVRAALESGTAVLCEKPFCLEWRESEALAGLAERTGLAAQVGYHYRFVSTFREAKRILDSGALGTVSHALAEAYGPVVLRPKGRTWRTNRVEGGGCLYDYAAHPLNLLNWYFGETVQARGTVMNGLFSETTDDEIYSTLTFSSGLNAHLSVNWSDESCRKMTTRLSVTGTGGRLYVDRQECRLYLRQPNEALPGYTVGWNVHYTTRLTGEVGFYLRGEEYSIQMEHFIGALADGKTVTENTFRSAAMTDRAMAMMNDDRDGTDDAGGMPAPTPTRRARWFNFGGSGTRSA